MIAAWMLYATVIAFVLGLAGHLAERVMRVVGSTTRWVWAATLVQSVTLLAVAYVSSRPSLVDSGGGAVDLAPLGVVSNVSSFTPSLWVFDIPAWWSMLDAPLLAIWTAMSLTIVMVLTIAAVRIRREARAWPERMVGGARVRVSPTVGPGVVGLLQPTIVIPSWAGDFDTKSSQMIVTHELEHMRALDQWLAHATLLVAALMPWNVAIWWQVRRLRDAIEVDCDGRVLAAGVDRRAYGELLVRVCQRASQGRLLVAAMSKPRSRLGRRIAVMSASSVNQLRWPAVLGLTAVTVLLVIVSCETPTPPARDDNARLMSSDTALVYIDRAPVRLSGPAPRYPEMLRQAGVEGKVVVSFIVRIDGSADESSIEIVESTNRAFEAPSRQVIAESRFEPAMADGRSVAVRVEQTITFTIGGPNTEATHDSLVQVKELADHLKSPEWNRVLIAPDGLPNLTTDDVVQALGRPMLIIDGTVIEANREQTIASLTPDQVASITVTKGDAALAQVGEIARAGVISIVTKAKAQR